MSNLTLPECEFRFASIVWDNEPLSSGELVKKSADILGWKKSTTYTVLKKLCERGILKNENAVVSSVVKREQVQSAESEAVMKKSFGGSLPSFVAAFLDGKKLSAQEAEELKQLIDKHREG